MANERELVSCGRAFPAEQVQGRAAGKAGAAEGNWRPMHLVELERRGDGRETLRIVASNAT